MISALQSVEDAPTLYATDFSHQYIKYGGYGNVWGLVTCDPDGNFFFFFFTNLYSNFLLTDHILPIAFGHQCSPESRESWEWFLTIIKDKFPSFTEGSLIMDRDKGGDQGFRY